MTVYKHSLADVIACAWWPNDGPVFIRPRACPFDDELVVKGLYVETPKPHELRARIAEVLRTSDLPMSAYSVTVALGISIAGKNVLVVASALASMRDAGLVKRVSLNRFGRDHHGENAARCRWKLTDRAQVAA